MSPSLRSINETLHNLGVWVPQVDESIKGTLHSLAAVDTRLNNLEAERQQPAEVRTPGKDAEVMAIPVNMTLKVTVPNPGSGRGDFPNTQVNFELGEHSGQNIAHNSHFHQSQSRPPKIGFPKFGGDNPKWWKTVCEKYFALYEVDHETWASFASMHFIGNAVLWLQSYEAKHEVETWEELCVAVHTKFG
jgi:hypothetical protein